MTNNIGKKEFQILFFETAENFERWLEENHSATDGIWLLFYKKKSVVKSMVYEEALELALCFGWIDGQLKPYDEISYLQKFTPRRPGSTWSKRNTERVARLAAEGRLRPDGLKEIEAAKADGRFAQAYETPGNMVIPDDFMKELASNKKATEFFNTLDKTNLYSIYWRLQTAKNEVLKQKRMQAIIQKLEKGEKFH